MPHDVILTPRLDDQRTTQLTRMAKHLDWQLDHPTGTPQPVAQSGLLEQLGTFLWEATHLEVDTVRSALDAAREAERQPRLMPRPLRLLLFVASREDLDPERSRFDFEREEELLYTAMDRPLARGEVEIDVAEVGDGTMHLPERQAFIERRREIRQYLRTFLEGETCDLLFVGPGGVGKTALAGRRWGGWC